MRKTSGKNSEKRDQYTVVLEEISDQFKVFGELQMGMDEKLDSHTEMIGKVMIDVEQVKLDVAEIKHDLKQKVGRDEFARLEKRVVILECHRNR